MSHEFRRPDINIWLHKQKNMTKRVANTRRPKFSLHEEGQVGKALASAASNRTQDLLVITSPFVAQTQNCIFRTGRISCVVTTIRFGIFKVAVVIQRYGRLHRI